MENIELIGIALVVLWAFLTAMGVNSRNDNR